jgi:hypothetical protein
VWQWKKFGASCPASELQKLGRVAGSQTAIAGKQPQHGVSFAQGLTVLPGFNRRR